MTGLCSAGYWCNYSPWTQVPDGLRDEQGALLADECPAGHWCTRGSAEPRACAAGTYSRATGNAQLADCEPCPGGHFCPFEATTTPEECAAGSYYPNGTASSAHSCPDGYWCIAGSAQPAACATGTYVNATNGSSCAECPARFYRPIATQLPNICPRGMYCPRGTRHATEHHYPRGSFGNATRLARESDCALCPPGMYCATTGLDQPTGDCAAGFFCANCSTTATPRGTLDFFLSTARKRVIFIFLGRPFYTYASRISSPGGRALGSRARAKKGARPEVATRPR